MRLTMRHALTAGLVAGVTLPILAQSPASPDTCRPGYVWREAFPGDRVCVTPETRTQASRDNSQAADRRDPAGPYGPNTCRPGFVWREAGPGDVVCVTPEVREQTRSDNAEAANRRIGAGGGGLMTPRLPVPPVVAQQPAYRMSDWSAWGRAEGVVYRYRWGWNPQEPRYNANVDAIFELRNVTPQQWRGAARSLDCSSGALSMSRDVILRPGETREVRFLTTNCGTRQAPSFRPNVVKSGRFD